MATVKLKLDRKKKNGTYSLIFQLIHDRRNRPIQTGISLLDHHWIKPDDQDPYISRSEPKKAVYDKKLTLQKQLLDVVLEDPKTEAAHIDTIKRKMIEALGRKTSMGGLTEASQKVEAELTSKGRAGNALTYRKNIEMFQGYLGHKIKIAEIDAEMVKGFVLFKQQSGCKNSSIRAYLAPIKALWKAAKLSTENPFPPGVIPSKQRTKKKAVSKMIIELLERHREDFTGKMAVRVDVKLGEFYMRGMPFADIIRIRPEEIRGEYFEDARFKNRSKDNPTPFKIKIIPKMRAIFDRYKGGKYALPILEDVGAAISYPEALKRFDNDQEKALAFMQDEHRKVDNLRKAVTQSVGYALKKIGINDVKLTHYTVRHTWATIARRRADWDLVNVALAHSMADMTSEYIDYRQEELDELNDLVCANETEMKVVKSKIA